MNEWMNEWLEWRNYTPAYVGLTLVVCRQKGIDLLRDLPQYRPATYLLYTVKNIISHDVFFLNLCLTLNAK